MAVMVSLPVVLLRTVPMTALFAPVVVLAVFLIRLALFVVFLAMLLGCSLVVAAVGGLRCVLLIFETGLASLRLGALVRHRTQPTQLFAIHLQQQDAIATTTGRYNNNNKAL